MNQIDIASYLGRQVKSRPISQIERDIKEIGSLIDHPAWRLVQAEIERGTLASAMEMGGSLEMSESEMHFRRGAIRAGSELTRLPQVLIQRLATELALAQAEADAEAQTNQQPTQP